MNDAEIREAVEICTKWKKYAPDYIMNDVQRLIDLATRYLELGGVVEEKEILPMTTDYRYGKVTQKCLHNYNLGRQDTLLAVSKRLEGIDWHIIAQAWCTDRNSHKEMDCDLAECIMNIIKTAIRESILGKEVGE